MPTGYTAFIEDGDITTGKEFLLLCSRAFGVAVDMRDEPLSVPTPITFEPEEHYKKDYINAVEELTEKRCITPEAARIAMQTDYHKRTEKAVAAIEKMEKINKRYAQIREQIMAWVPPTIEHEGIKNFALEQIDMCVYKDSEFAYYKKILETPIVCSDETVQQYIKEYIEQLEENVEIAKKRFEEEVKCAESKTKFMREFVKSLANL